MSVEVEFVKPTDDMIAHIASNMRRGDIDEVWASHRHTPMEALKYSRQSSKLTTVVTINDNPCAMLGLAVRDKLSGVGSPWMLSTDEALKNRRNFITLVPDVIDDMLGVCSILVNYVHVENKVSIRWLSRIGFTIEEPEPHGPGGELFHRFHLERNM